MQAPASPKLDLAVGDPYQRYRHSIKLLHEYIDSAPHNFDDAPSGIPSVSELHRLAWRLGRKPILALFGEFDSGKSTVANAMLGAEHLPTGLQPTTRIPTYVAGTDDRPSWISDQIGVFAMGFDVTRLLDREHSEQFFITSGGTEILQDLGVHTSVNRRPSDTGAQNIVFFLEAPILSACNILDLPGYDNDDEDTNRADATTMIADIAIYISPINGFLKSQDLSRLSQLIRLLPVFPSNKQELSSLQNLYIVATHVPPHTTDMDVVFDRACDRAWRLLDKPLQDRLSATSTIAKTDLRGRFFLFTKHQRFGIDQFCDNLRTLLRYDLPIMWDEKAQHEISRLRTAVPEYLSRELESFRRMMADIKAAKVEFEHLMDREPENRRKIADARSLADDRIQEYRESNRSEVAKIYRRIASVQNIETVVREKFPKKEDAKDNCAAFVLECFRREADDVVKQSAEAFATDVEAYLGQVERTSIDSELGKISVGIPFNVRGTFQGALVGAAGMGALAVWSGLAYGGSFGFYILTAKLVSVLSMFGVSISGGTAAVISGISAIGAPLAFAIGLVMVGSLLGAFGGRSWQERLSGKIRQTFEDQDVLGSYREGLSKFWDETASAFESSCRVLEEARDAQIENYRGLLFDGDKGRSAIEESITCAEEYRDFFSTVPWSSSK